MKREILRQKNFLLSNLIIPHLPQVAVLLFMLVLFCSTALAQQRIYGTVFSKTSRVPIEGVHVTLESDKLAGMRQAVTDSNGRYSFSPLSPGEYTISITVEKFTSPRVSASLAPRDSRLIEFEIEPLATLKEEITVTAPSTQLDPTESGTISTLSSEQILALPGTRRMQLTDIVPLFGSSAVGSHDNLVHLRGNELSLNNFVNGVSFFDNPHQLFTPGLSPDIIRSVNVITGGFPAEFGNRFGGILDIVTRSGFDGDNHGSVSLGAGTLLNHNISVDYGGHTERFGYFLFAQGFENARFLNTPEPERFHDFGKGLRNFAQFDYKLDEKNGFRLSLSGNGTNFQLPNGAEDESRGRDFFQRNREQTAVASWDHFFDSTSALSTSLYERYVSSRLSPTSDPISIQADGWRNTISAGLKSDYSLFAGERHAIKTGVDFMRVHLREDMLFDPRDNDFEMEPFDFRGQKTGGQASFYFQDKVKLTRRLTANLGLRYDSYHLVSQGQGLSPRLNLAYAVNGGQTVLHFAYNRFFSPPPFENLLLSARLGFERQPPHISRSHHFETGVRHSLGPKIFVDINSYWRSDRNAFETTELANVRLFAPTTFSRGKAYGIEFTSRLSEIQRLGISAYLSYTAQRAFLTGPISGGLTFEEVIPGERSPAAFDQIHTAVAGMTWRERRSRFWTSATLHYGSGTPASLHALDGHEALVRLPNHLTGNICAGIDLWNKDRHGVSLQFAIDNVTNRLYRVAKESEFTPVQYSSPRIISSSVRYRF